MQKQAHEMTHKSLKTALREKQLIKLLLISGWKFTNSEFNDTDVWMVLNDYCFEIQPLSGNEYSVCLDTVDGIMKNKNSFKIKNLDKLDVKYFRTLVNNTMNRFSEKAEEYKQKSWNLFKFTAKIGY